MTRTTEIKHEGKIIGFETRTEFPAGDDDCTGSGIAISHGVWLYSHYRGMGHGGRAHMERLESLKKAGYNYVVCTVREDNKAQLHILLKNGWVKLATTASSVGSPIYLMGRDLLTPPDPMCSP